MIEEQEPDHNDADQVTVCNTLHRTAVSLPAAVHAPRGNEEKEHLAETMELRRKRRKEMMMKSRTERQVIFNSTEQDQGE